RFRDQLLAESIAVSVSCVKKSDAEIERLVHERDRFALGKISPPAGGDRPESKSDFADLELGVLVSAKLHREGVERSPDCRVESKFGIISASASRLICSRTRM